MSASLGWLTKWGVSPELLLVGAVLAQAANDARAGDPLAVLWLLTDGAALADLLCADGEAIVRAWCAALRSDV